MASIPSDDISSQTARARQREQEALAALAAHRAGSDLPSRVAADNVAQNDRLRALDALQRAAVAEQRAIDTGLRVYRDRRSKLSSPAALPAASASSLDHNTRGITSLADQLAESTAHVRAKPSDFALGLSTYSGIGQEMIRRKKAHVQRLYDILQQRARHQNGNAIATATEICDYTESLGLGRGKAARVLKDSVGLTLEITYVRDSSGRRQRAYRLRSKEAICATLGLSWPGPRVDLPDEAYTGSLTDYCAFVYSAFWHGQEDRSYTRSTLQKLFGVTHNTLIAWEGRAGILARPRYQEADAPKNDFQTQELATHRGRRFWLTVRQGERAICTAGLLDGNNDLRENYQVHADHARQEATRKPDRTLKHVWQEANTYEPTRTRLSASGRSRHITRNLTTPDHEHKQRFSSAQGGSSTAEPPRRFHTLTEAVAWQSQRRNRDKCAAVHIGQRAPVTRPPRVKRYPTAIYAFQYSFAASFDLPAKPEPQQMRLLQRGW